MLIGFIGDSFISCTLPVFFFQRVKTNDTEQSTPNNSQLQELDKNESDIRKCLRNKKCNSMFLHHAERSYCPEDIMFWNAVEQFKSVSTEKSRQEIFFKIVKTYLVVGAPLELNVARKDFNLPEIISMYEKVKKDRGDSLQTPKELIQNLSVRSDLFNALQTAAENNMVDNFVRFQQQYAKIIMNELA